MPNTMAMAAPKPKTGRPPSGPSRDKAAAASRSDTQARVPPCSRDTAPRSIGAPHRRHRRHPARLERRGGGRDERQTQSPARAPAARRANRARARSRLSRCTACSRSSTSAARPPGQQPAGGRAEHGTHRRPAPPLRPGTARAPCGADAERAQHADLLAPRDHRDGDRVVDQEQPDEQRDVRERRQVEVERRAASSRPARRAAPGAAR